MATPALARNSAGVRLLVGGSQSNGKSKLKVVIVGGDPVISLIRSIMAADVESKYDKDYPFLARLKENYLLNKEGTSKDTRHLVIDLSGSGLTYTCGDSLGVYPTHRMGYVREVLEALGATGEELIVLPRTGQEMTLREAMAKKVSLAGPNRKFLLRLVREGGIGGGKSPVDRTSGPG